MVSSTSLQIWNWEGYFAISSFTKNSRRNTWEISNNENRVKPHREWHHLQPKTLRHLVCESFYILLNFLISTLDSHLDT